MSHTPGVCTHEIRGVRRVWPPDDGVREMTEDEFHDRIVPVQGRVICVVCGVSYFNHPREDRLFPETSTVLRLCNGWLGKY